MEEKIVRMEKKEDVKKPSYEELQQVASQLSAQNQQIVAKFKELNTAYQELLQNNYFVRLEWLWKVANSDVFPKSFKDKCINEFMTMMTPESEDNTDKE